MSIAIVDDHPMLVEGIASLMERKGGFSVVATGADADTVLQIATDYHPNVMLVDLNMAGNAIQAISDANKAVPDMKVIVFTASMDPQSAIQSLEAGASGYVLKGSCASELFDAITAVREGAIYITPSFAVKVIGALQSKTLEKQAAQSTRLSFREDQIVRLLLCGKRNAEIAHALSLSEKTVKGYMTNLMHKLNVRNRLEVVIAAQKLQPASVATERGGRRAANSLPAFSLLAMESQPEVQSRHHSA